MSIFSAQVQPFSLSGSGAVSGATSITLKSFQDIDGNLLTMSDFGVIGFMTMEPGSSSQEEQISFTGVVQNANGTATISGVKNVLFLTPYTATSGLVKTHAGSTIVVVSNTSGWYNEATFKKNNEAVDGYWTFPAPLANFNPATKKYVDDLVSGGNVTTNALIEAGTAGETVAAGNPVYLKAADGRWWKATGSTAATVNVIQLGIAQGAGTAGTTITGGVLRRGVDTNQSGGAAGSIGYISNTSTIATSAGTTERAVGNFLTATTFDFDPSYYYTPTADQKAAFAGNFGTPSSSNKFLTQTGTVSTSAGAADVSKIPKLNTSGLLDISFLTPFPAVTLIPPSAIVPGGESGTSSIAFSTNTTAYVGQVIVPFGITVNKITIRSGDATTVAGTVDLSLYTEDGQTQKFSVTTASIAAANTLYTTAVSAVALTPGVYYIMMNTNGTTNVELRIRTIAAVPFSTTASLANDVASEPVMQGTLTITAGTPPATFDPTAITDAVTSTIIFRLDN